MRTTLTLDPDVAALLKKAVAKGEVSFKQAVNDALRRGLTDAALAKPKKRWVQRLMPPGEFLIDITDNAAIQEMWDREDYPDLYRREPPTSGDGPKGE
jgi:hypothetical protein